MIKVVSFLASSFWSDEPRVVGSAEGVCGVESGVEGVGSCAQERGGPGPEVESPEEGTGVPQLMWAPPSGFWPGHTHVGFSVDSVGQMGVSAPGATSRVSWAQGGSTC